MPHQIATFLVDVLRLCLWLAILAAVFVPLERLFSVRPLPVLRPALLQDLGLYFLNSLIPAMLLGLPTAVLITMSQQLMPAGYFDFVEALPLWVRLAVGFTIAETGFYWGHRWMHAVPLLWHFHAVHHEPTSLDWLNNTRAHPVDILFTRLCGLVPLYLLGFGQAGAQGGNVTPIVIVLIGAVWGFFIHANLRWRLPGFEQVFSTPRFHHWHHSREDHINRNFASTLPFLDRIFGTFHMPAKAWPPSYGISEQNAPDAPRPKTIVER